MNSEWLNKGVKTFWIKSATSRTVIKFFTYEIILALKCMSKSWCFCAWHSEMGHFIFNVFLIPCETHSVVCDQVVSADGL